MHEGLESALSSRYRVDRELGRGGMATVFLAMDVRHDRKVALKVLHPELSSALGPDRFLREIKLAARLNQLSALNVIEASDGVELLPGTVVLARGGIHLRIERQGDKILAFTTRQPATAIYTPSVDVLLTSAALACGKKTLGVVLTGMGDDGAKGLLAIHRRR